MLAEPMVTMQRSLSAMAGADEADGGVGRHVGSGVVGLGTDGYSDAVETRQTPAAVTAFVDVVLPLPAGLDARQTTLARGALSNIPRPPRVLSPRLVISESLQLPLIGSVAGFLPGLVNRLRRDVLAGARGIGRVTRVERAMDLQGNSRNFWWVAFDYVVDDELMHARVRTTDADAADADNARVVPIVVDVARPRDVIVWWSALDVR